MENNNDLPFAKQCSCGAVTVTVLDCDGNEQTMSMAYEIYIVNFSKIPLEDTKFYNCDHCINHYGVDLCGCGSGQLVGECDNDCHECKNNMPSQQLITEYLMPTEHLLNA